MNQIGILHKYYRLRYNFFSWRYNTSIIYKMILMLGMACITGIAAQIRIPLPWSPVPITGQTFAVLMSGVILGSYWGGLSQLIYILIGIAGVPWFSGATAGINVIFGPTGGYLIGFILSSFFLGYFVDKYVKSRNFLSMLGLMLIANFVIIYTLGLIQLGFWLKFVKGSTPTLWSLLMMGAIPFIPGGIFKIILASGLTKVVTPKVSYDTKNE